MSRGGGPRPPGNRAGPHRAEVTHSQGARLREEGDAPVEQERTTSASLTAGRAAGGAPPPSPGPHAAPSSVPAWAFSVSRGFLGAARGPAQWLPGRGAHPLWCLLAGGGKCWGLRLGLTCTWGWGHPLLGGERSLAPLWEDPGAWGNLASQADSPGPRAHLQGQPAADAEASPAGGKPEVDRTLWEGKRRETPPAPPQVAGTPSASSPPAGVRVDTRLTILFSLTLSVAWMGLSRLGLPM